MYTKQQDHEKSLEVERRRIASAYDPAIASLLVDVRDYKEAYFKMKERGVKLRVILTITKDNANKCLELTIVADVRHLDETIGNFGVGGE